MPTGTVLADQETNYSRVERKVRRLMALQLAGRPHAIAYAMHLVAWVFGVQDWPDGEPAQHMKTFVGRSCLEALKDEFAGIYPQGVGDDVLVRCRMLYRESEPAA